MNAHLQAFLLRTLKRNGGPITETQLVTMSKGAFLDATDSDVRGELAALESEDLVVTSRVPVLNTKQYGLTAAGVSAAAALR